MEVKELNSRLLRVLGLFAIAWVILWSGLAIVYYFWFSRFNPVTFGGWWFLAILFQPSVLLAVIAIPEIIVLVVLARLKRKESQQWRKK